ncbi:aquaporin [Asanoa sp. NPDC050611]|uniref:MIP/aquaporin family protein n=1 Tax=Asanoa sp. NPDC050611 TaxID=3157098 RepID=UPI0033DB1ACA
MNRADLCTRAGVEFALTTVVLFVAVTVVRWVRDDGSPLFIADLGAALAVIGAISGSLLTGLILSPLGRRSGGHLNPAVTIAVWAMGMFPGRAVVPYAVAQLAGSVAGTGLAWLVWREPASHLGLGAIQPALTWTPAAVFSAEAGSMAVLFVVLGVLVERGHARLVPYTIGLAVGLVIAVLGPLSGGSINPARQLGPAVLSGETNDLWIYLVAPVLGAALGSVLWRFRHEYLGSRRDWRRWTTARAHAGGRRP